MPCREREFDKTLFAPVASDRASMLGQQLNCRPNIVGETIHVICLVRSKTPTNLTLQATSRVDKLTGLGWQYRENILRLWHFLGHPIRNFLMKRKQTTQKKCFWIAIPP
jgi:hypothetical protein